MKNTPINFEVVKRKREESNLPKLGEASIRELVRLVNGIEAETGEKFVRMEMGVPGFDVSEIGKNAEKEALDKGYASKYATLEGITPLKNEISRFVKLFLDIDVKPEGCIPTVGSLQGSMILFLTANRAVKEKKGVLFIDPGFPIQKLQCQVLGQDYGTFDVYNYRGDKLKAKLESLFEENNYSTILYSNPNNPSWISFTEKELKIIGEIADKYDTIILEDLAYFGMDFRKDYSQPGKAPFQPSVAKYTDNWVMLISSSKSFSYAGQRVGMMVVSDKLFKRKYPDLKRYYTTDSFGYSLVYNTLYALSAGVPHTPQHGLAAILKAVNDGEFNFRDAILVYGERAKVMKKLFTDNGFKIVYDNDEGEPIADGFYFTFSYPGMSGGELLENLIYYGISAIALQTTGSLKHEGLRACVSQTSKEQFGDLEKRLKQFNADFGKK